MKKLGFSLLCFFLQQLVFTQSIFDQLVEQVEYAVGDFNIDLNFYVSHYTPEPKKSEYADLTEEQLLKLADSKKDDVVATGRIWYQIVMIRLHEEKYGEETDQYFTNALVALENWANEKPEDPEPVEKLYDLSFFIKNQEFLQKITNYAEKVHTNNMDILNKILMYYLDYEKNFQKFDEVSAIAQKLEPDNLEFLMIRLLRQKYYLLLNIESERTKYPNDVLPYDITLIEAAAKRNPKSVGHQHLLHYARLLQVFTKVMLQAYDSSEGDANAASFFEKAKLNKNHLKILDDAYNFLTKQLKNNISDEVRRNIYEQIGVIHLLKKDYSGAKKQYQEAFNISKKTEDLQTLILIAHFMNNMDEQLKLAEDLDKLTPGGNLKAKLFKLKMLTKKGVANETLEPLIQEVINHPGQILEKYESLSLWYAKNKDLKNLDRVRTIFEKDSLEYFIYAVLSYALNDQIDSAKFLLKTGMEKHPGSVVLKRLDKILNT